MTLDCIYFCQCKTIRLKYKEKHDGLWFKFVQTILEISSKSFDYEQLGAFLRIHIHIHITKY